MSSIVFALPGNEILAARIAQAIDADVGTFVIREFPDKETYLRILSPVKHKRSIIVCTLDRPDNKLVPLYFLSKTLKALGADSICLIAPYLGYMRQDKIFNPGEGETSAYFASLVSGFAESLITVDPHLHRRLSMSEIYSIPTQVLHASSLISSYISKNITCPVIIGPDSESEQWVAEVAKKSKVPFLILNKTRTGDREVNVSLPEMNTYKDRIPVLVDDIISTARTMIETVVHLKNLKMKPPVCIGVHAVFSGNSYEELQKSGVESIVTCNTISHSSNKIDISELIATSIVEGNSIYL